MERLHTDPDVPATVILERLPGRGFPNRIMIVKESVAELRPRVLVARQRTTYLPGEIGHGDWWERIPLVIVDEVGYIPFDPEAAGPGGREVHRPPLGLTAQALPVHGDRRLHQDPGPPALRPAEPDQRSGSWTTCWRSSPSRSRRSRPTTGRSSEFHYQVLDRGIGHVDIKPATPG